MTVTNSNASSQADIRALNGAVTLTAGVPGSDFAIVMGPNAGIAAGTNVVLQADAIAIEAAITAGQAVNILPNEVGTAINLGGVDTAGSLGLSVAEIDLFSTPMLSIGRNTSVMVVAANIAPSAVATLILTADSITGAGSFTVPTLSFKTFGAFSVLGASDVDNLLGSTNTGAITFSDADGFAAGSPLPLNPAASFALGSGVPITRTLNAGAGTVSIASTDDVRFAVSDAGSDLWIVTGAVDLTGAILSLALASSAAPGTEIVLIQNDGDDPIVGEFDNRSEGELISSGGRNFIISYKGGTGNDLTLTVPEALVPTLSADKKKAVFTDVDGDIVTVKTSKGKFDGSEFLGLVTGENGASQLQVLMLDADFAGTNLTVSAKPGPDGGNGFVNIGRVNATGVDLGRVKIAGDLGKIDAGTFDDQLRAPGLKSLTVQSLGLLGDSTQGGGGSSSSVVQGGVPKLLIKDDMRAGFAASGAADGKLGTVRIGGSIVGGTGISLRGETGIGSLVVGGDIRAGTGEVAIISFGGSLGSISVGGSIIGLDSNRSVFIAGFGSPTAPAKGLDLALKSLKVAGSVEWLTLLLGGFSNANSDASAGSVSVGGDWIASTVIAGVALGPDLQPGTADDAKIGTQIPTARDNPALVSTIGSFTVKGQAFGTGDSASDMFGIVAERIGKAKVGGRVFAFTGGQTPEAFFAAPTLGGAGAENPMFDFTIRELGSATPIGTVAGGIDLKISGDGRTATFNDVDGDIVTVKRSSGTFVEGDFTLTPAASGGGVLEEVEISSATGDPAPSISFTARPGPDGGNGRVNVGSIDARDIELGDVLVSGELQELLAGTGAPDATGVRSLTVSSLGVLADINGLSGGLIDVDGDLPRLSVQTGIRAVDISIDGGLGTAVIGGSVKDDSGINAKRIDRITIRGSLLGSSTLSAGQTMGVVTIEGDLVGVSNNSDSISAFGAAAAPGKGPDVAIGKLLIRGTVENTRIDAGLFANADASIGTVSIGRGWIGSNLLAGVRDNGNGLFGTGDDAKADSGGTRDQAALFSQIASVTIKGQAVGSAALGDAFGIVAEQIGKAKIGKVKLKFDAGERDAADAFAIAPTGPGATGLPSDFFIREITA